MTKSKMRPEIELERLALEVSRVADALEKQNNLRRRLFVGLIFGVGTALGASIVASILVFMLSRTFLALGVDLGSIGQDVQPILEEQIQLQTPQE